ncbi:S8 family serine peptidase [Candidatus Roizmanbacteria bacterium]|nr:S8 family serine peptidase [Candidatus Roizmanbacteria bacterium]
MLQSDPNIEYAIPNYIVKALASLPNDTFFGQQWALHNTGQTGGKNDADIDLPEAWEITKGSDQVIIAVLDTGIDYLHPDLGGCIGSTCKILAGYDFTNNDNDPMDDNGHGTHVSGIIAGITDNQKGIAGVCPNCRLMPVKFLDRGGGGGMDEAVQAVYYAVTHNAKIINNSWGTPGDYRPIEDIFRFAHASGVLSIGSAGNTPSDFPLYPAGYDFNLSVAATNNNDTKTDYSTFNNSVDVTAPGGESAQAPSCEYSPQTNILSTANYDLWYYVGGEKCGIDEDGAKYAGISGTSMAAPHVAGLAGLLLSQNPSWTNDKIAGQIKYTTDSIDETNPDWKGKIGTGRINAYQALTVKGIPKLSIVKSQAQNLEKPTPNDELEPGKTSNFLVYLTNSWEKGETVKGTLSTTHSQVSILKPSSSYGTIDIGEIKENQEAFTVKLAPSMTIGENIPFILSLTYKDETGKDYQTTETFEFPVSAPKNIMKDAAVFKKTNSTSILVDDSSLDLGSDFTIEGWYHTPSYQDQIILSDKEILSSIVSQGKKQGGIKIYIKDRRFVFSVMDTNGKIYEVENTVSYGMGDYEWNYFTAMKIGSELKLFRYGVLVGKIEMTTKPAPIGSFTIGALKKDSQTDRYLDGWLDEIRISNIARYTSDTAPWPPKPFEKDNQTVALYHFDGKNPSKIDDSSGNNRHGKVQGKLEYVRSNTPVRPPYTSVLKIYADAIHDYGSSPHMEVYFDNAYQKWEDVEELPNARQFKEYVFTHPYVQKGTAEEVEILFQNDFWYRTLIIDKINVDGRDYQSEDPATFGKGIGFTACYYDEGHYLAEILGCDGYFRYELPSYDIPIPRPTEPYPSLTPSPTLVPSPTAAAPILFLQNGSFEEGTNKNGIPNGWRGTNLVKDKDKVVAKKGRKTSRAFRFTSLTQGAKLKKLIQSIGKNVPKDTKIKLTAWNKLDNKLTAGEIKLRLAVLYKDDSKKTYFVKKYSASQHAYIERGLKIKLEKDAKSVDVELVFSGQGSQSYFDDISLTTPDDSTPLDPPTPEETEE